MKTISVQQPWASLIAHGEQRFYATNKAPTGIKAGMTVAIHAMTNPTTHADNLTAARNAPIDALLAKHKENYDGLPFGAVIATVEVVGIHRHADYALQLDRTQRKLNSPVYAAQFLFEFKDPKFLEAPVPVEHTGPKYWDWQQPKPPAKQPEVKAEPTK